jgi:hypothetical protein
MTSKGIAYKMFAPIKFFFENGMKTKHKKFNFDQMSIQKKICFTCLKLYMYRKISFNKCLITFLIFTNESSRSMVPRKSYIF